MNSNNVNNVVNNVNSVNNLLNNTNDVNNNNLALILYNKVIEDIKPDSLSETKEGIINDSKVTINAVPVCVSLIGYSFIIKSYVKHVYNAPLTNLTEVEKKWNY